MQKRYTLKKLLKFGLLETILSVTSNDFTSGGHSHEMQIHNIYLQGEWVCPLGAS